MDEDPYVIEFNGQTIRVQVTDATPITGTQVNGDGWYEADDWKCRTTLSKIKVENFLISRGLTQEQIDKLNMLSNPLAARAVAIDINNGDHTYFLAFP